MLAIQVAAGRQARDHGRHRAHEVGRLEREAQRHLPAVRDAGREHARAIGAVLAREAIGERAQEADVVDVERVRGVGRSLAAVVPMPLEAVGVDRDEARLLRQHVEVVGVAAARLCPVALGAVQHEHQRGMRHPLRRKVGVPAARAAAVLERAGDELARQGRLGSSLHREAEDREDRQRGDDPGEAEHEAAAHFGAPLV